MNANSFTGFGSVRLPIMEFIFKISSTRAPFVVGEGSLGVPFGTSSRRSPRIHICISVIRFLKDTARNDNLKGQDLQNRSNLLTVQFPNDWTIPQIVLEKVRDVSYNRISCWILLFTIHFLQYSDSLRNQTFEKSLSFDWFFGGLNQLVSLFCFHLFYLFSNQIRLCSFSMAFI